MEKDFLQYISGFANEGETTLVVKQTPTKDTHKDGSTKHVWPAYLPSKRRGEGAWYGNTGVFIKDRFKDGKPSASAACVEYVGCMVLDDIGTKSKTPPLPPTWIMETSPGNFQWGYAFSEQPTKGDYNAAIIAIADAGYTDPGAINSVRNFRLPGSINLKPTAGMFKSKLVEFHPDREYTLENICAALDVTPAPADTSSHKAIKLDDDGTDDVYAWLNQQGLILEDANGSGWAGVVCPNAHEHSDGNPMGRYNPINRAYCCLHAHCGDWNTERFLSWVEAEGGPSHQGGLRAELLALKMQKVYEAIQPGQMFSKDNEAAAVIAEVEQRELARLNREELHDFFAYVEPDDGYFDLTFRREFKRRTFDAIFAHLDTNSQFKGRGRIGAGRWFDENRHARNGKSLAGITYAPGETVIVAQDGLTYGNKWMNARPVGVAGDVSLWLNLLSRMIPEASEREHILNVMAYKRQHPNVKINHAVLIIGQPGIGKDTFYAPFLYSIGGKAQRNVHIMKGDDFSSQFTYGLENEVLVLNELRQPEGKDRRAVENMLKPIIAAPPEFLTINRKGLHPYEAVNRLLVLAGSNYDCPISLPGDDRRWFVVKSHADRLPDELAARVWAWYINGGFEAVAAWLQARDVSMFNPGARPPMTEAKLLMIEQGMSGAESYLLDLIETRSGVFESGVISAPWHKVLDRIQGGAPNSVKLVPAALFHALKEAGWRDGGKMHSKEHGTKKHIFYAPEHDLRPKADIRAMVEPTADKATVSHLKVAK